MLYVAQSSGGNIPDWANEAVYIASSEFLLFKEGARGAASYTPKLAQRGLTVAKLASQQAQWGKVASGFSKAGKVAGAAGVALTYANAGLEVYNGTDNTSTWVDVGLTTGIVVVGVISAPVAIVGGLLYGGARLIWADEMDALIDDNFGYK